MKSKFGTFCMILGAALLIGALFLFIRNEREAAIAERAALEILPQLLNEIGRPHEALDASGQPIGSPQVTIPEGTPVEFIDPSLFVMTEVEIDGYPYIGYLSIPKLGLNLPIMADWDYTRLHTAPCRYSGTVLGEDLVILAHNYKRHFGTLSQLDSGDAVTFIDMDGTVSEYAVVGVDILPPNSVEEVTAGNYDLVMFTCTYGGKSRVTVYCNLTN